MRNSNGAKIITLNCLIIRIKFAKLILSIIILKEIEDMNYINREKRAVSKFFSEHLFYSNAINRYRCIIYSIHG